MLSSLPVLAASIVEWMKTSDKLETAATSLEGLHTIQQVLLDAQSNPHHSLTTLSDRLDTFFRVTFFKINFLYSIV